MENVGFGRNSQSSGKSTLAKSIIQRHIHPIHKNSWLILNSSSTSKLPKTGPNVPTNSHVPCGMGNLLCD
ncbi:hypothetical protein MTR_5g066325 [Medicago truncatula]|uniref:Uncharacterized protein n=1 Tax=Medicago truncatula TaxID=3880 RepID=A0A072UF95_MEDTR|nr:hypothetical protein MTR_5g066325 [Medicago truncatula]